MKLNILHTENNDIYYTDVEEAIPEIYRMTVCVKMLKDANDQFKGTKVRHAPVSYVINTVTAYHFITGQKLPTLDIFKIAQNKMHAPFVTAVYKSRLNA